jgi:hypothetical protein
MKLTDPEFIDARRAALENNPRSYEPWYETIMYGREVEKIVKSKYWRDFSKEKPHEEGSYIVVSFNGGRLYVDTMIWSNRENAFTGFINLSTSKILVFKPVSEIKEDLAHLISDT